MTQLKDLYMGSTMDDLDKMAEIPDVSKKKIPGLLLSAKKLCDQAEIFRREGDEERAYIFYMRYFNLLASIHKKPDYVAAKQHVRDVLGGNSAHKQSMDKLEVLSKSLKRRYDLLTQEKSLPTDIITNKYDYAKLSASEKFDLLKRDAPMHITSPTAGELSLQDLNSIKCEHLFKRIQEGDVLIMDCRSSDDYDQSHLMYQWAFNVPEEHISDGMSAGKLLEKLDAQSKAKWSARSIKDHVVLMDWSSRNSNLAEQSPIAILMNILQNWDPDVVYRSPIKVLEEGFEYFIMMYPTLCTNPSVQRPQENNEDYDIMEEIEYPTIHDITMKDEIRERGYSLSPSSSRNDYPGTSTHKKPPSIDRSSKQAALKTYDENQKPLDEIKEEQAQLMQKADENDEELLQTSKELNIMLEQKQKSADDKQDLTEAEKKIMFKLMELESRAEDFKIENDHLREELQKHKQQGIYLQSKLSSVEAQVLKQNTQEIESKFVERQRLDEQREHERLLREKQLAIAREYKRHMKPPNVEDNEISCPKMPQFDRSIKPQTMSLDMPFINDAAATSRSPAAWTFDRHRDFSPVPGGSMGRGLTGLKNLGNTCYMNSILQCLSNTPQLAEYCITDKYKNYISRTNRTKGQVVEEVAALIKILWNGNYKCVASKDLRYVIGQYQQIFRGIDQQDSHEFLTILMDLMHSDLQTLPVPEKPRGTITASEKAWLEFTKARESLILHLFYGQMKSTVKCSICLKESATYECFSNLSLELPSSSNVCLLNQCMDMYFSGEHILGWNCPSCKQKRTAIKKLDISKLPPVLVIHMKRFYADSDASGNNSYKKKQNYVKFPLKDLDMTPYIAKSESRSFTPKTYQLYGVSNHYGSMESGHYTAFCKSGNNGKWFKFDDQVVMPLDSSNVVTSAAYILFYTFLPPIQINENNNN